MLTITEYIDIDPETEMTYEVHVIDGEVEITIGSRRGLSNSLRLTMDEPQTCTKLADVLLKAAQEFDAALSARYRERAAARQAQRETASPAGEGNLALVPAPS